MKMYDYGDVFDVFGKYYNNKIEIIDEPGRSVVMVISSKGIIDNGGFRYFFESDFPNGYLHRKIAYSYEIIGEFHAASLLNEACQLVGDVVGMPLEHRKILIDKNVERLDELSNEYYKIGNQIDNSVDKYSNLYCSSFHSKWWLKLKLLFLGVGKKS